MNIKKNKYVVSFTALVMAMVMMFGVTACTDKTWCVKDKKTALPMGVYICNMFTMYNQAYSSLYSGVQGGNVSLPTILNQKIEDKNVGDWIKEKAELNTKNILSADQKMEELGLSLSDEEIQEAKSKGDSTWASYGAMFKKYGVARESFDIATGIFEAKEDKIAQATGMSKTELTNEEYKESVKKETEEKIKAQEQAKSQESSSSAQEVDTSDEAVKKYFLENYTSYSYMSKQFADPASSGTTQDTEADVQEQFSRYEKYVNDKEYTIQTLRDRYKNGENLSEDPLKTGVEKADNIKDLPDDVKNELKNLANDTAKSVKSGNSYYIIYKEDINNQVSKLDDENFKNGVISAMKGNDTSGNDTQSKVDEAMKATNDIYEMLKQISNSSQDIVVNTSGINNYQPSMFEESNSKSKSKK